MVHHATPWCTHGAPGAVFDPLIVWGRLSQAVRTCRGHAAHAQTFGCDPFSPPAISRDLPRSQSRDRGRSREIAGDRGRRERVATRCRSVCSVRSRCPHCPGLSRSDHGVENRRPRRGAPWAWGWFLNSEGAEARFYVMASLMYIGRWVNCYTVHLYHHTG